MKENGWIKGLVSVKNFTTLPPLIDNSIGHSLDDFIILSEIGRGSSGIVYKVQSKKNNAIYALKSISLKHVKVKRNLLQEIKMLKALKHPNIIEYYGSFMSEDSLCIVTEFAEYGDLRTKIKIQKAKFKRISEKEIWTIASQIALGLLHLHSHQILHRDIKTLNIVLTKENKVKLGDLGESAFIDKEKLTKGKSLNSI